MQQQKAFSLNKILSIVNLTRSSGISVGSNFIVGLPTDTEDFPSKTGG